MNDKYNGEKVLVFPRHLLKEMKFQKETLLDFQGIKHVGAGEGILFARLFKNTSFIPRYRAEEDFGVKQIIPYVVIRCGGKVFSYVRGKAASEGRLVGGRSVGIGGHINPQDGCSSDLVTMMDAMDREIDEEISFGKTPGGIYDTNLAISRSTTHLINDESNEVGKVHFGVVHIIDVLSPELIKKKEDQIEQSGFFPLIELACERREELENWSKLVLDALVKEEC